MDDVDYTADGTFVANTPVTGTTDVNGEVVLECFPNARPPTGLGTRGTVTRFVAQLSNSHSLDVLALVPDTPCNLVNILTDENPPSLSAADIAVQQAQQAVSQAQAQAVIATTGADTATNMAASATASAAVATAQAAIATTQATAATGARNAIDGRIYPGTFAVNPTTRPDGSAIQNGDRYVNSTDGYEYLRSNGVWTANNSQASAAAAAASASAAHTDRLAADADLTATIAAMNSTLSALIAAGGIAAYYNTKAAANTALAGLAANAVVMVFADESVFGHRTIYRKESGVFVLRADLSATGKTVYLDTVGGNDSNTGMTPDAPVLTSAVAVAMLLDGDTLRIHGRSRNHKALNLSNKNFLTVDSYGGYGKAVIDGSRPITGVWTNVSGNLWKKTVVHEVAPDATSISGLCMWREDATGQPVTLFPKWTAGSQAANQTFVGANSGYFTCNRTGSATADPRADTFSTSYDYFVYSTTEPSVSGSTFYYAEAQQVITGFTGHTFRNLKIQRTAHKDMAGVGGLAGGGIACMYLIEDCEFHEASQHGWVSGALIQRRNRAYSRTEGGDYTNAGGGGIHLFRNTDDGYRAFIEDCVADGFGHNLYEHPGTFNTPAHREVFVKRFTSRNAKDFAVSLDGWDTRGVHIDGYESFNDKGGLMLPAGSTLKNFRIRLKNPTKDALGYVGVSGGTITATNGSIVSDAAAPSGLAQNNQAGTDSNVSHTCNFNLTNVTAYNVLFNASIYQRQINWTFTDCVMGNLEIAWALTQPFLSVTATNSQLGMYRRSLAEIQARTGCSGVDSTCLVPWQDQVYTKAIVEATDLRYVDTTQAATISAVNTLSFNINRGTVVGDYVQIMDYKGTGASFKTRLIAGSGNGPWTVSPPFDAFTAGFKTCNVALFNRKLFPATVAITAQFSDDGTQALLSDISYASAGTILYFGAVGRRDPIGPRKVTAVTGSIVTLDRPVTNWRLMTADLVAYPALGVAGNQRPSFPVTFNFPLRPVENISGTPEKMTYTLDRTASSLGSSTGNENPGSGGKAVFTSAAGDLTKASNLWDSQGNQVTYGHIHHEVGEIDCGFAPLGPTDVLTVNTVAYVDEYAPQFASDPLLSGSTAMKRATRLADMKIGCLLP
jgi:hypothetical protein